MKTFIVHKHLSNLKKAGLRNLYKSYLFQKFVTHFRKKAALYLIFFLIFFDGIQSVNFCLLEFMKAALSLKVF